MVASSQVFIHRLVESSCSGGRDKDGRTMRAEQESSYRSTVERVLRASGSDGLICEDAGH